MIRTVGENISLVELDIALSDHGMSFSPTISPDQRRLLKLPTAR
ncbi:MAG: hypothetical protein QF412_15555 [Planctomycetota bacterium]|nr:hypothetical protein [Planctomycetota bacterium]